MQHAMRRWLTLIVLLGMLLSTLPASAGMDGCGPARPSGRRGRAVRGVDLAPAPAGLCQDAETGIYARPWGARALAAKIYLDMATILENYPDVHVTFNSPPA
jgi:hypothetical protein